MDMLVLIMLALFLMVIAFVVIIYVVVRRNSSDKIFNRKRENDIGEFDDLDDEDDINVNIPLPSTLQKVIEENHDEIKLEPFKKEKEEVYIKDEVLDNYDNVNHGTYDKEEIIEEINDLEEPKKVEELKTIEDNKIENTITLKHQKVEEVVNILINRKNYIFLANNNVVSKNDRVRLIIDNKIYFGIVTKANYYRDINLMKIKPRKLIIVKSKPKKVLLEKEIIKEESIDRELEFIPIKKNRD